MQQIKILCRVIGRECRRFQICTVRNSFYSQKRQISFLLNWFINVFNRVDMERLKILGPDCTCAEWLLRNGGKVRLKGHRFFMADYKELITLEESQAPFLKVEEIYAKGAAISSIGFDHLNGCMHVKKITLIFCSHVTDLALQKLIYVKDTLEYLEIRSCFNVGDNGVKSLVNLINLKTLILADLISVQNVDECELALKASLSECDIKFQRG